MLVMVGIVLPRRQNRLETRSRTGALPLSRAGLIAALSDKVDE